MRGEWGVRERYLGGRGLFLEAYALVRGGFLRHIHGLVATIYGADTRVYTYRVWFKTLRETPRRGGENAATFTEDTPFLLSASSDWMIFAAYGAAETYRG